MDEVKIGEILAPVDESEQAKTRRTRSCETVADGKTCCPAGAVHG